MKVINLYFKAVKMKRHISLMSCNLICPAYNYYAELLP